MMVFVAIVSGLGGCLFGFVCGYVEGFESCNKMQRQVERREALEELRRVELLR